MRVLLLINGFNKSSSKDYRIKYPMHQFDNTHIVWHDETLQKGEAEHTTMFYEILKRQKFTCMAKLFRATLFNRCEDSMYDFIRGCGNSCPEFVVVAKSLGVYCFLNMLRKHSLLSYNFKLLSIDPYKTGWQKRSTILAKPSNVSDWISVRQSSKYPKGHVVSEYDTIIRSTSHVNIEEDISRNNLWGTLLHRLGASDEKEDKADL